MMSQGPSLGRKLSAPWDRLRPVKQDPLESVGFVSKGDNRLLSIKTQESYYHKITARYMQFCAQHSKNLNKAFESLSLETPTVGPDSTDGVPATPITAQPTRAATSKISGSISSIAPDPPEELSNILTALRKLREAILATSSTARSPTFSQRVHVFNIRLAILALHPESYHASLRYLLTDLNTPEHPLPQTEFREMTAYLILDTAIRLGEIGEARAIFVEARHKHGFRDKNVDIILHTIVNGNWPLFWRTRSRVDGYMRALIHWGLPALRKTSLKAIGRSYMKCDIDWILLNTSGGELTWDELVEKEDVGWLRDGSSVIIRKPKPKS